MEFSNTYHYFGSEPGGFPKGPLLIGSSYSCSGTTKMSIQSTASESRTDPEMNEDLLGKYKYPHQHSNKVRVCSVGL